MYNLSYRGLLTVKMTPLDCPEFMGLFANVIEGIVLLVYERGYAF
jgi:hypothetical protein